MSGDPGQALTPERPAHLAPRFLPLGANSVVLEGREVVKVALVSDREWDAMVGDERTIVLRRERDLRDLVVAALNYCDGASAEQIRDLRMRQVTPLNILGAIAMQGVEATVVNIAERLRR